MNSFENSDTVRLQQLRLHRAEERKTPPAGDAAPLTLASELPIRLR